MWVTKFIFMKRLIISLLSVIIISISTSAREVYCTIQQGMDKEIRIIPNNDYLMQSYWYYIIYDTENNTPYKFETVNDAVNHLALFGWKLIKINLYPNNVTIVTMGKEAQYYELKSSRDKLNKTFKIKR